MKKTYFKKEQVGACTIQHESATYECDGYRLKKCNDYWYAVKDHVFYATPDGPTDTLAEMKRAVERGEIAEW